MKKINWKILLSVVLIGLSLSIYFINYSIFHKGEDTVYYFLIDLAFLPLSILLVTLIVVVGIPAKIGCPLQSFTFF